MFRVMTLGLVLFASPGVRETEPVELAQLEEHRIYERCIPWVVVQDPKMRRDFLVCDPVSGDDFQEEFSWNWL